MKKLLLDSCTKTTFCYDNVLYQQCDGVSIGSLFAPVLAIIILTEFEEKFTKICCDASHGKWIIKILL